MSCTASGSSLFATMVAIKAGGSAPIVATFDEMPANAQLEQELARLVDAVIPCTPTARPADNGGGRRREAEPWLLRRPALLGCCVERVPGLDEDRRRRHPSRLARRLLHDRAGPGTGPAGEHRSVQPLLWRGAKVALVYLRCPCKRFVLIIQPSRSVEPQEHQTSPVGDPAKRSHQGSPRADPKAPSDVPMVMAPH